MRLLACEGHVDEISIPLSMHGPDHPAGAIMSRNSATAEGAHVCISIDDYRNQGGGYSLGIRRMARWYAGASSRPDQAPIALTPSIRTEPSFAA